MLRFAITVLSTVAVCVSLSRLVPEGNWIALILLLWGSMSLGAVVRELCTA
jgi:hypothetical protein